MPKRLVIKSPKWFNVRIELKNRPDKDAIELDMLQADLILRIAEPFNHGEKFMCGDALIDPDNVSRIQITETKSKFSDNIGVFERDSYTEKWRWAIQGKDVADNFIQVPKQRKAKRKVSRTLSKNVFIVHGRDHKPMKELKTMLYEFGLNPIVLHEQPSGSRTIVEKLEKYSDVGYAFVILTPDDLGGSLYLEETTIQTLREQILISIIKISDHIKVKGTITEEGFRKLMLRYQLTIDRMINALVTKFLGKHRARQNVVLEFGYFIGLLSRDRVCCLYKGDVELPSDMHGIVYIPFKGSIDEVQVKIIKELTEAGYEIKL